MTTEPQPADLLAPLLALAEVLRGSQQQCDEDGAMIAVSRQALDETLAAIASLAAHRGEVAVIGYVRRAPFYTRDAWKECTKADHDFINANGYWTDPNGFNWPSITRGICADHLPQAQAGAGDAIPKASPLPTQADFFSAMHNTLGDAANAVKVLSTMLRKEGLREGLAVADEILGNIKHVLAALEAKP